MKQQHRSCRGRLTLPGERNRNKDKAITYDATVKKKIKGNTQRTSIEVEYQQAEFAMYRNKREIIVRHGSER